MTSRYPSIDLSGLRTSSIADRKSKVCAADFAVPVREGASVADLIDSLPDILAGRWLREIIDRIARAHVLRKPVVFAMGAHVIKCGLSPVVADLIRRRVITCVATNGAGAIHDSEIALYGATSEDVPDGLRTGMFGMAAETAQLLNSAALAARDKGLGYGEALGEVIVRSGAPNSAVSLLAAAYEQCVPLTVHVSIVCGRAAGGVAEGYHRPGEPGARHERDDRGQPGFRAALSLESAGCDPGS